ncbi:helix-turn-helix domain-containing protein [Nocardia farcinica]|uniref:TetR/AcrR family transcriptional regulator n=1 Tax=Nocardia farcinica TaxID=37329 RepID=UPI00313D4AA7
MDTLLEAAAQMFTRRGLAATTNHIAERAGLSIGTLYQYFPNKEALLHALAARHLAEAQARLMPLLAELRRSAPEFEETVRQVLEVVVDLHRDRPALHALLHRVAPRSPREVAALRAFEDRLVESSRSICAGVVGVARTRCIGVPVRIVFSAASHRATACG